MTGCAAPTSGAPRTKRGLEGFAEVTRPFAERARRDPAWRFHHLAAIHDAFIDAPRQVADLYHEAARST